MDEDNDDLDHTRSQLHTKRCSFVSGVSSQTQRNGSLFEYATGSVVPRCQSLSHTHCDVECAPYSGDPTQVDSLTLEVANVSLQDANIRRSCSSRQFENASCGGNGADKSPSIGAPLMSHRRLIHSTTSILSVSSSSRNSFIHPAVSSHTHSSSSSFSVQLPHPPYCDGFTAATSPCPTLSPSSCSSSTRSSFGSASSTSSACSRLSAAFLSSLAELPDDIIDRPYRPHQHALAQHNLHQLPSHHQQPQPPHHQQSLLQSSGHQLNNHSLSMSGEGGRGFIVNTTHNCNYNANTSAYGPWSAGVAGVSPSSCSSSSSSSFSSSSASRVC